MDNVLTTKQSTVETENSKTFENKGMGAAKGLNALARIFIIAADVAFVGVMAYIAVLLIFTVAGSNIDSLFGGDSFDLGFFEMLGIFAWAAIALIVGLLIAVAIVFIKLTDNYYRVLKISKSDDLKVVLAPWNFMSFIFPVILVLGVFGFLILGFVQNHEYNIITIAIMVSAGALLLALVFAIAFACVNRARFNRLNEQEKTDVKELSKTFRKKVVKAENKTRTGKLY